VPRAAVRILHLAPDENTGELSRLVATARALVADDLARRFEAAGADDVEVIAGPLDDRPFGDRLRAIVANVGGGLVVLGSGSIPLATDTHLATLLSVATSGQPRAVTNNRYSSDVLAIGDAGCLRGLPDLAADNLLPRWLAAAGIAVAELPDRDRLALDIDSPIDLELLRRHPASPPALVALAASAAPHLGRAGETLDRLAHLGRNPSGELLVAGRLAASTLRRLETGTACRVRALIEERGLRASAPVEAGTPAQRPPGSVLGLLLDRDGPAAIGTIVERLADGALIDSRVLLAHRLGADEAAWPSPEDRYASDLLLGERIRDPWLQALTIAAAAHGGPIAFGGHSLVGPGLDLALGLAAEAA
jgi:CTP:molybdopterin cytidylyltransferase MocA